MKMEFELKDIIKKVRQIEIRTRAMLNDALSGSYHSVFKGQGLNFEEVREYAAGDEVRFIDWNVTARANKPFVKVFREERELTLFILVDISSSQLFGSTAQSKRELAGEIASLLALSATRNNDKVGLLLFSDHVEKCIRPNKSKQHILKIVREILFFDPKGKKTNIVESLNFFNRIQKKKSIVFLISDFLGNGYLDGKENELMRALRITGKHHDLICTLINDPKEKELPNVGKVAFEDLENNEVKIVDTGSAKTRKEYEAHNKKRLEDLQEVFKKSGLDSLEVYPGCSYVKILKKFFNKRISHSR